MKEVFLANELSEAGKEELKKVGAAKLAEMCCDLDQCECPCVIIAKVVCQIPGPCCHNVSERDWNEILNKE